MSSFQKISKHTQKINGTKILNAQCYVSSGVPSLDHVIGGGIPTGSIFMLEEDVLRNYSRVMRKYFIAEGLVCKHDLLLASLDGDDELIMQEIPTPTNADADVEGSQDDENSKMKIAWRYENIGPIESTLGVNSNFGHFFDLSRYMDSDSFKDLIINYWNASHENDEVARGFHNKYFYSLLKEIQQKLDSDTYKPNSEGRKNVLRISIDSLGSPLWTSGTLNKHRDNIDYKDMVKFMYFLRSLVCNTNAVAYVSVPTHLFDDATVVKKLGHIVDSAVRLESFAGSDRETNPVFKDYHGLFHVAKISAINTLVTYLPPTLDLAFKLRRKKFVIEKLHLPPELQESSEREQDEVPSSGCGIFNKKNIDF